MIRRLLIAMAAGLMMLGAAGARLGQAQQEPAQPAPKQSPVDEPDGPPPLGNERNDPGKDDPKPDDDPLPPAQEPKTKKPATKKAERSPSSLPQTLPTDRQRETLPDDLPTDPDRRGAPAGSRTPRQPLPDDLPTDPDRSAPDDAPKNDPDVLPVQSPASDGANLGPAKDNGQGGGPTGPASDQFILPADRLPLGPSTGSLTVEVQGPATANLNRPVKFKIFVKNSGVGPVMGVIVRDPLPESLEFVKSEPACTKVGNHLVWHLESLSAGQERTLVVTAIPRATGDFDHAPTVSLRMGSRSRTMVKHPKLKVEIVHNDSGPILKGRPVNFQVRVTNNGTGPARAVVLHADLTPGLTHEQGSSLVVDFKEWSGRDSLASGESETVDLQVDASAGGEQECRISATSPDVEDAPEAKASAKVTVVEPKLEVDLKGSSERYTDTVASYTLTVKNPGTAVAKNVVAAAFLPNLGGQLIMDFTPSDAKYGAQEKKLWWPVGDLEPGTQKELKFNVQLRGPGMFKVAAGAKADRCPQENKEFTTQVVGMPDIKCEVVARSKVLDVGEETIYEVRLSNTGTKEAADILVTAILSDNLRVEDTTGTEGEKRAMSKDGHDAVFPALTIAPRASHALTMKVKAIKEGKATCTVKVVHGDSETAYSTTTKVIPPR